MGICSVLGGDDDVHDNHIANFPSLKCGNWYWYFNRLDIDGNDDNYFHDDHVICIMLITFLVMTMDHILMTETFFHLSCWWLWRTCWSWSRWWTCWAWSRWWTCWAWIRWWTGWRCTRPFSVCHHLCRSSQTSSPPRRIWIGEPKDRIGQKIGLVNTENKILKLFLWVAFAESAHPM